MASRLCLRIMSRAFASCSRMVWVVPEESLIQAFMTVTRHSGERRGLDTGRSPRRMKLPARSATLPGLDPSSLEAVPVTETTRRCQLCSLDLRCGGAGRRLAAGLQLAPLAPLDVSGLYSVPELTRQTCEAWLSALGSEDRLCSAGFPASDTLPPPSSHPPIVHNSHNPTCE